MSGDMGDYRYGREFFELKIPKVQSYFVFILLAVLLGAFIWCYFGSIDIVVKAEAVLRPSANISTLKNSVTGKIIVKNFSNGQRVQRGDLLWKIDGTAALMEREILEGQLRRGLAKAKSFMLVDAALTLGDNRIPESESDAYARADAYFTALSRLRLSCQKATRELEREKALPQNMRETQKIKDLELDSSIAEAERNSFEAQETLKVKNEIENLDTENEDVRKSLANIEQELSGMSIVAPLDGVIDELKKTNEGDYLFAGEEVVRIIPGGDEVLKAQLSVDSRDIARIAKGMTVNLRFSALPPSEYGQLPGKITQVPADSSSVENAPAVYVLEASLPTETMASRKGEIIRLKAGMVAEARIIIERKRIFRYILEKLDFTS
jgi:multidrug resistance efflux pump